MQTAAALGTENFPFQNVRRIGMNRSVFMKFSGAFKNLLNSVIQFMADDGFMSAAYGCPFVLIGWDLLVVNRFGASLYQITGVNRRAEYFIHRPCLPFTIPKQIFMCDGTL